MQTLAALFALCCVPHFADDAPSIPRATDAQVIADIQRRIERAEYEVTPVLGARPAELTDALYGAPSRAQQFSTAFLPRGVRIVPWARTPQAESAGPSATPAWCWGLELLEYGRTGAMRPAPPAAIAVQGARVEYRRGELLEGYDNFEEGLEQTFSLARRPEGVGALRLEMEIVGSLHATLEQSSQAVVFADASDGRAELRFEKLTAFDHDGRTLEARFELCGERLAIVVDDDGATYPITIDPLAASPDWTATGLSSGYKLGFSVATAGDVNGDGYSDVIIGTPLRGSGLFVYGYVEVFHGSANGLSTVADWSQLGSNQGANFGHCVATAGDVNGDGYSDVIISSYKYTNGQSQEGAAFVYHGGPAGLATTPAWSAEGNQIGADFGWSVASLGDANGDGYSDVIVGAPRQDFNAPVALTDAGRTYAYLGSPSGLTIGPVWTRSGTQDGQRFGACVAAAGDVNGDGLGDAIVGAPKYDHTTGVDAGAFYVIHGNASTGLDTIAAPAARFGSFAGDQLGFYVATAGDVNGDGYADIVAGAPYHTNNGFGGIAYLYNGQSSGLASSWSFDVGWSAAGAEWGYSVATAGDINADGYADVVIGAPLANAGAGQGTSGVAYVFFGSSVGLQLGDWEWRVGAAIGDRFGHSVATAGDVNGDGRSDLLIGASEFDAAQPNAGRAHVYHSSSDVLPPSATWTLAATTPGRRYGYDVDSAGDLNGDGYDDIAFIGRGEGATSGVIGMQFGGPNGPNPASATAFLDPADNDASCAGAGDINGDGYDDVIAGVPGWTIGQTYPGHFRIYPGGSLGLTLGLIQVVENQTPSTTFAFSVSTAGDVDGDGYADVLVGDPEAGGPTWTESGIVYLYRGSASGLITTPTWLFSPNIQHRNAGYSVSGGGDFNGDGYDDILIGAPRDVAIGSAYAGPGEMHVFYGSPSGVTNVGMQSLQSVGGGAVHDRFGKSVACVGDLNGDGYADAAAVSDSKVSLFMGGPAGLFGVVSLGLGTGTVHSVSRAGDVDGDGLADLAVLAGSPRVVQLYRGQAAFVGILLTSPITSAADFAQSLGGGGDTDGDGYADVLTGWPLDNTNAFHGGAVRIHNGNGRFGAPLAPRQRQADDSAPIAWRGWSDDASSIRLAVRARTPYGRTRVRLETEVKPTGVLMDGSGTVSTPAFFTTAAGAPTVSELRSTNGVREQWRMRLRYDKSSSLFQHFSRWFTFHGASWNEAMLNRPDFRPFHYCTPGTSTNGCTPTITALGSSSLTTSTGLDLVATGLESNKLGGIYYGVNGRNSSSWGSSSILCVKAPTQRMGSLFSGGTTTNCTGVFQQDWMAYIGSHPTALGSPFTAGEVINVQAWYRDPPATKTTNLTDAVEFVVLP